MASRSAQDRTRWRAPHRLVVELEEVQHPLARRRAPPLAAVRVGADEIVQRHPQHPAHLDGTRREREMARQAGDDGHDVAAADDGRQVVSSPTSSTSATIEADLLVAPRGTAASPADSPRSMRPPGKLISPEWLRNSSDRRVSSTSAPVVAVGEGDEHGRGPRLGEVRLDRMAGRRVVEAGGHVGGADRRRVRNGGAASTADHDRRPRDALLAAGPPPAGPGRPALSRTASSHCRRAGAAPPATRTS